MDTVLKALPRSVRKFFAVLRIFGFKECHNCTNPTQTRDNFCQYCGIALK